MEDPFEVLEIHWAFQLRALRAALEPPREYCAMEALPEYFDRAVARRDVLKEADGPPPWAIGFTRQFKKDTESLDRKIQGRVLEILEELSDLSVPIESHGDTFKPLTGELKGCWRYRIGDWRLVVRPVPSHARIDALALGPRGSVYD